jgi:acetolactate decarboxylase
MALPIRPKGSIHLANDSAKTPFADVTSFQPDIRLSLEGSYNLTELEKRLEGQLPTNNLFYAIRIDGTFDQMTTRSVSAQSMPYPSLEEALRKLLSDSSPPTTSAGWWRLDTISTS